MEKVIEIKEKIDDEYKMLNIISLVHANQEVTRLVPMLLSKMVYDEQKSKVAKAGVKNTVYLIIDEAHNILNTVTRHIGDDWQDYRLTVFEEVIKEGRKFGFYITLSSQRPSDMWAKLFNAFNNE